MLVNQYKWYLFGIALDTVIRKKLYIETNEMTSTCTGSVMYKLHIFRDQLESYTLLC